MEKPKLTHSRLNLHGVDGSPLTVLGKTKLLVKFVDEEQHVDIILLKDENVAILGMNEMAKMKITINTADGTVSTGKNEMKFVNKLCTVSKVVEEKPNYFLMNDELLPPRSHKIVYGRVVGDLPTTPNCLVNAERGQMRYGIIMPNCLAPTARQVPLMVYNNLSHALKLKRNATLGRVDGADLIEPEIVVDMDPEDGDPDNPVDNHPLDKVDLSHLEGDELLEMQNLLRKHGSAFSRDEKDLGKCPIRAPRLKLKDGAKPIRQPARRYNVGAMEEMIKQTRELEEQGILEPAPESQWCSWPIMCKKICSQTGAALAYKRYAVDLRQVNDALEDGTAYSGSAVPRIVDIFDSLAHALKGSGDDAIYAKLDISQAFFNIELEEEDRDILAFQTPEGLRRPTRLPYGLKMSPSGFTGVLALVLVTAIWLWVWAFLDDLLIVAQNFKQLVERLDFVLYRLRAYGLKLKPVKAIIAKQEVPLLGFKLSKSRVLYDPFKKEACRMWATPTTKKETLRFVQFCNFLRKSIENFSHVAKPLYAICKDDATFEWTKEADDAFQHLKRVIAEDAGTYLPVFHYTFYLCVDWSAQGGSWALCQRAEDTSGPWRQILYGSRPNSKAEASYASYFGEMWNLANALNSCRPYLENSKSTIVWTDHASLTRLFSQKHLSAFQIRVINSIADIPNIKIVHKPGSDPRIGIVDRLSRARYEEAQTHDFREMYREYDERQKVNAVTRSAKLQNPQEGLPTESNDFWIEKQNGNQDIVLAKKWVKKGFPTKEEFRSNSQMQRALFHNREALLIKDGVLYRKWIISEHLDKDLIIVPPTMLPNILFESHDLLGHNGNTKTLATILTKWWCLGLQGFVNEWIRSCNICQRRKIQKTKTPLQPITKSYPLEKVFFDIKTMDKNPSNGHCGYVVVVEGFSKHVTLFPIKNHTPNHIMGLFFKHFVAIWGWPKILVSDQESSFGSAVATEFYRWIDADKRRTVSRRAAGDGMSEIFVKISKNILTALLIEDRLTGGTDTEWDRRLP